MVFTSIFWLPIIFVLVVVGANFSIAFLTQTTPRDPKKLVQGRNGWARHMPIEQRRHPLLPPPKSTYHQLARGDTGEIKGRRSSKSLSFQAKKPILQDNLQSLPPNSVASRTFLLVWDSKKSWKNYFEGVNMSFIYTIIMPKTFTLRSHSCTMNCNLMFL